MRVMIVVTHLLGTGHLSRAATLARAFLAADHQVTLVSGGMPARQLDLTGIDLVQLPPLRSDGTDFTTLLDDTGGLADDTLLERRQNALIATLDATAPDILITELFPFGRRILSDEFLALLVAAAARPRRPVVLASVRDILAPPSRAEKAARTDQIITRHYDAVLVHADPRGTRLEASWPVSGELAQRLRYTGYVAPAAATAHPDGTGRGEVLVSAGGGGVGTALFQAAIHSARLRPDQRWRLLVGGSDTTRLADLRALAGPDGPVIEPARPDFRQMLSGAAASISLCGYNTALDLLQCGTPAVLVPFDDGNEVEQGLRANSLARLPGIAVLRSADLTPDALATAVDQVIADGPRRDLDLDFDGAQHAVQIACDLARART